MSTEPDRVPELSKKVCLLGDFAVGKTSLMRRFVYDFFDDKYISTIGVKVSRKTVSVPLGNRLLKLNMMLWDMAGSDEFARVRSSYLRGAAGAVLVCDLTRPNTLGSLTAYAAELWAANPGARLVLVANKYDRLEYRLADDLPRLEPEQVGVLAAELGVPWYITSAKTGESVEAAFRHLGRLLGD